MSILLPRYLYQSLPITNPSRLLCKAGLTQRHISNWGLKPSELSISSNPSQPVASSSESHQYVSSSSSVSGTVNDVDENGVESFEDVVGDLERRKRRIEGKRRQKGAGFVDHMLVTIRGGKGGSGAAAFEGSYTGSLGPPSGGNGGAGGAVYIQTSPSLSSLSTVSKRAIGGQGSNGAGSWKHGRKGTDIIITVPIGTIITEIKREGEEERIHHEEKNLNMTREERLIKRRERWFIKHPSGEIDEADYQIAEDHLRKDGKFLASTPDFIKVPPMVLDLLEKTEEPIMIAQGGQGGLGNPHFQNLSIVHKGPPKLASRGTLPATLTFSFELKLLADVGLVGFPNSGKSTLLRGLSGRRAEVADYSFTTLNPQIGVVRVFDDGSWSGSFSDGNNGGVVEETRIDREIDEFAREIGEYLPHPKTSREGSSTLPPDGLTSEGEKRQRLEKTRFTLADNPGLLPSASENYGLGHSFLKSIERSQILVYVLDLTRENPSEDLKILRKELEAYLPGLSQKGALVILNKGDKVDEEVGRERVQGVRQVLEDLEEELEVLVISGKYGLGLDRVVNFLAGRVQTVRKGLERSVD